MVEPNGADSNSNETETCETMELSLRLDGDGRTTYDPALRSPLTVSAASIKTDNSEPKSTKKAKTETSNASLDCSSKNASESLDYSSKTALTNLASLDSSNEKDMNDLLFDCEIADCGLLPRTFWVPATGTEPRCYLEKLALEIFHHHVPSNSNNFYCDPDTSGAEWWVQVRPSPPGTGRYSMLAGANDGDDGMTKSGISFHWDKDEDLRLATSMWIHPHVSTVTYLTDIGAPTTVLSKRVHPMTGEYLQEQEGPSLVEGFVSWPRRGKHLSFDGRLLHAAPSDLMEEGLFEKQCSYDVTNEMDEKTKKTLNRKNRRVTFLVNIWLNYKPLNVNPFPETMISNLSKIDLFDNFNLFGRKISGGEKKDDDEDPNIVPANTVIVRDGKASIMDKMKPGDNEASNSCSSDNGVKLTKMKWSMGQKDEESVEALMPVEVIRSQGENGSDVVITWNDGVAFGGIGA